MTQEQVISKVKEMVSCTKKLVDDVEFSLEDATKTDLNFLYEVIKCAIDSGALP